MKAEWPWNIDADNQLLAPKETEMFHEIMADFDGKILAHKEIL